MFNRIRVSHILYKFRCVLMDAMFLWGVEIHVERHACELGIMSS